MGVSALWYVCVFAVVTFVLQKVFKETGVDADVTLAVISAASTRVYMLVIGIVCPVTYFGHYLAVGVTRKRFAAGMFAAGAALSLCFAALRVPLLILEDGFSLTEAFVPAFCGAFTFIVGWTASVGFQYMRAVPIISGLVCSTALYLGMMALEYLGLPAAARLLIAACGICVVGAALLRAVKRIPVAC
jgi:hypothetical protein